MKHKLLIIGLALLFSSCIDKVQEENFELETVVIDLDKCSKGQIADIFNKIEIVPLETSDSILVSKVRNIYTADSYYIIMEQKGTIHLFDKKGKYISNSSKVMGEGPQDYSIVVDVVYNRYTNSIDILSPYGEILSYDSTFCFKRKTVFKMPNKHIVSHLFPINDSTYIITPSSLKESGKLYFYNINSKEWVGEQSYNTDLAKTTSMNIPFSYDRKINYYSPSSTNMYVYRIMDDNSLMPIYALDFKEKNVPQNLLANYQNDKELSDFLFYKSDYALPLRKFINHNFFITNIKQGDKSFLLVYKRNDKKAEVIEDNINGKRMLPFFALNTNILSTLAYPHNAENFIDTALLDNTNRKLLNLVSDDDNPIIIKYYLK